jgi:glyoxylase-like metal-dependent hydrolase (beta-lactamase superfamily II)
LFSGDLLLRDHPTVTKLPGGDKRLLAESLRKLAQSCPDGTTVYPGHGPAFPFDRIGVERTAATLAADGRTGQPTALPQRGPAVMKRPDPAASRP